MAEIASAAAGFREEQEAQRQRPPADVFISYACQDREKARLLCSRLVAAGVAYFLDEKDIRPGDEILSVLEAEIRQRGYYLVLLSHHSMASQWVTYEWAFAKGAGCNVRILKLESDVTVPPPLSSFLAGNDLDEEALYYAKQQYDRMSLAIFLRDVLKPLTLRAALAFRRVPGNDLVWEHPDINRWPEEDRDLALKRQLGLANDPLPRVRRIAVRLENNPPQIVLDCEREQEFKVSLFPKDNCLELIAWWSWDDKRTAKVHPAFWRASLGELVSLLDGRVAPLTPDGTEVDNQFPVTWA